MEKIDASLVKKASEAAPINGTDVSPSKIELKKRKKYNDAESLMNTHVPKKRNTSAGSASTPSKTLTLSQREEKAMEDLASYVEECGGMFKNITLILLMNYFFKLTPTSNECAIRKVTASKF